MKSVRISAVHQCVWGQIRRLTFALILLTSCCVHLPQDKNYAGPQPKSARLISEFAYQRHPISKRDETLLEQNKYYSIRRIEFEPRMNVLGTSHIVILDYYDIHGTSKTPLILVLPISGGGNQFANHFASYFAKHGFASLVVHRREIDKYEQSLETLNPIFKQIILDHMQALDWADTCLDIDKHRIGIFGMSAGAVKASLLYSLEDRIKAAVLALAGGDIPHIFAYSKEEGIREWRNTMMTEHQISRTEFYNILKERFVHDPLNYAQHANARNILMVLAAFDKIIPFKKGVELRARLGHPETIVIPTGHYTSVLYLPYLEAVSLKFFRKKFSEATKGPGR